MNRQALIISLSAATIIFSLAGGPVALATALNGGSGNDRIYISTDIGGTAIGNTGNDYLESTGYDGSLDGGDGDDTLNGPGGSIDDPNSGNYGYGSATLTGGLGADKFICSPDAFETITDYNPSERDTLSGDCDEIL